MRMDIRRGLGGLSKYRIEREDRRTISCNQNIALNSTIAVKVGKKLVPMKTTSHRKRDLIEATANGKKHLCTWWMGEWTADK